MKNTPGSSTPVPVTPQDAQIEKAIEQSVSTIGQMICSAGSQQEQVLLATSVASLALGMIYSAAGEAHFDQFIQDATTVIKEDQYPLLVCPPEHLN